MEEIKRKAEEAVLEITEMLRKKEGIQAIALRGSLITDHFTKRSDIDLLVITTWEQPKGQIILKKGLCFHIRYLPQTLIESMLRLDDNRIIDLIVNSKVIADENGVYQSLHNRVSRGLLSKAYLKARLEEGLHGVNDAQGHFEMKDYEATILDLRRAALNFAEVVLLTEGITYLKRTHQPLYTKKLQLKHAGFVQNYNRILGIEKVKKIEVEELIFRILEMLTYVQTLLKNYHGSLSSHDFGRKKSKDRNKLDL